VQHYSWKAKKVNYTLEAKDRIGKFTKLRSNEFHPLKPITVTESSLIKISHRDGHASNSENKSLKSHSSSEKVDFIDPLSMMTAEDPLTKASHSNRVVAAVVNEKADAVVDNSFAELSWTNWKMDVVSKSTVDSQLAATMTSILRTTQGISVSDKMRDRLGQLDEFGEASLQEMLNLSQQEFIDRIHFLSNTLTDAWNTNQKVKSLKIAIQCAKLLGDTSVMQFYPSKFILVTDLLDTFGSLVFERIFSICNGMKANDIKPENVSESAKEICLNWILKVASIRELLPRIYVEASIIRCNEFLKKDQCKSSLIRLNSMTRGVGNPLVALYTRAYLCSVGMQHLSSCGGHFKTCFYDFLSTFKQMYTTPVQNLLAHQKLTMESYLGFYAPALTWILSCVGVQAHDATLNEVFERCNSCGNNQVLFDCCISAFSSKYIASRALVLCTAITKADDKLYPKFRVLQSLGKKLIETAPPNADKLMILNETWKMLVKIRDPGNYIACAVIWVEYAAKYFTQKETNTVLGDIIKHMSPDRVYENFYTELQSVVVRVITHMTSFKSIFAMSRFLPFFDMFQKDGQRVEVCKLVAEYFINDNNEFVTSDATTISGLINEGQVSSAAALICGVILKINFGKDFEQQLSFYVECRASFSGLDNVLATLVHSVNRLSAEVTKIVKGKHTRKTSAFVRACSAYSFITIPSLSDSTTKFGLYLESGQVALISQCVTQADAYRSGLTTILDLATTSKSDTENSFLAHVSNLLSSLLVVPDNTEQGVLFPVEELNVISESDAEIRSDIQCAIYIKVLAMLTAYSQEQYLYHVHKVDSNEDLYSNDPKFMAELSQISTTLLNEVLAYLVAGNKDQKLQSFNAFNLFQTILAHGDITESNMNRLAVAVWEIAIQHGHITPKSMLQMMTMLKNKGGHYKTLAHTLKQQIAA
uniref:VPS35 endosomal protein-sorting factor-like n=1 Tax=Ciona savignyi TaxID=51511 RepID=H2ZDV4_CIOSA